MNSRIHRIGRESEATTGRPAVYADLLDAFKAMEVGDCLQWDVDNPYSASSQLYNHAKSLGFGICIRCPTGQKQGCPAGRLFVMRFE